MSVAQAQEKKVALEVAIADLLVAFTQETKLEVRGISLEFTSPIFVAQEVKPKSFAYTAQVDIAL